MSTAQSERVFRILVGVLVFFGVTGIAMEILYRLGALGDWGKFGWALIRVLMQ